MAKHKDTFFIAQAHKKAFNVQKKNVCEYKI